MTTMQEIAVADDATQSMAELSKEKSSSAIISQFSDHHLKFADFEEAYLSKYIQLADVKSGATFAITSGLLVFLVDKRQLIQAATHPQLSWIWFLAFVSGATLLLSSCLSFAVVYPRLRSDGRGIIFWKNITARDNGDKYNSDIAALSLSEIASERLRHCFTLAKVCESKYGMLRLAMLFGSVGVILSCLLLALA